jgi:hypothetical protein
MHASNHTVRVAVEEKEKGRGMDGSDQLLNSRHSK